MFVARSTGEDVSDGQGNVIVVDDDRGFVRLIERN